MKYKVGDIVKTRFGKGIIVKPDIRGISILVYHFEWNKGHDGNSEEYKDNHCWWFEENELELVLEVNSNFAIMPERYIINKGTTVLFWSDGTKTIVKKAKDDKYDKRLGFLTAYFQKTSGLSKNKANKYLDNLIEE